MDGTFLNFAIVVGLMIGLIGTGIWIFGAIILVAIFGLVFVADYPFVRMGLMMQNSMWNASIGWELLAIPLYIWMGELLLKTDLTAQVFRGLVPWVNRFPGGLLHTNVLGCTVFAAVSGSSTATTAAIGKITADELGRRGYSKSLSLGSLAGSGTLGIMIPPSIPMIVYGVLAEVSISRLFVAGIVPGLLLAFMFSAYIAMVCTIQPRHVPQNTDVFTWRDRLKGIRDLAPITSTIVIVMGAIYSGIATPSEAAAVGVMWSLILVAWAKMLTWKLLRETLMSAALTSAMLCVIIVSASFLAAAFGLLHLPQGAARVLETFHLSAVGLIVILTIAYIVLGCLLDGVSMIVLTLPLVLPMVVSAGLDPIWFGVYLLIVIEMAMVTPPVGFNLFVIRGITGEPIGRIAVYAIPFFMILAVLVAMLFVWPQLVTMLPDMLMPLPGKT